MSDHYEAWLEIVDSQHPEKLTDEQAKEIFERTTIYGSSNCWTGTAGTLAKDCRDLIREREFMLRQIYHMRKEFSALGRVYTGVF